MKHVRHISWWLLAVVLICAAGLAEYVIRHTLALVLVALAGMAGAYLLGRRRGARRVSPPDCQHHVMAQQVDELEQVAGRSIGAVIESYQHIQSRYRTGGQR